MGYFGILVAGFLVVVSCSAPAPVEPIDTEELEVSIYQTLKDSLLDNFSQAGYDAVIADSIYARLYEQFYEEQIQQIQRSSDSLLGLRDSTMAFNESVHNAKIDSLRESIYDSLYREVYQDIYSASAQKNLRAYVFSSSEYLMPSTYDYQDSIYGGISASHLIKVRVQHLNSTSNIVIPGFPGVSTSTTSYRVTVKARVPGLTETASATYLVSKDTTFALSPALKWEALSQISEILETQIEYEVVVLHNDKEFTLHSGVEPITILPVNMFPYMYSVNGIRPNIKQFYARWVQVVGDSLSALIQSAKSYHPDNKMVGYQLPGLDSAAVPRKQVEAIYEAIKARNISYVMSTISGAGQRVRTPTQTLRDKSAVCIDGAVLFAAAMGAVGLHPVIVVVPGHAFVGWKTWKGSNELEFLETTMVNTSSFAVALKYGYDGYVKAHNAGQFSSGEAQIIDVLALHEKGLTPFPTILQY